MTKNEPLVSAQSLYHHLDGPQVVVVDCRFQLADPDSGYRHYLMGHIPGAHYLDLNRDLSSPAGKHGGRHPLPDPNRLAEKLAAIGITSGETFVVAYDDSRFAFAARLWWLLRYLGHDRVAVLNGGWKAWTEGGYSTSDLLPTPRRGQFILRPRPDWIADIEAVKARKDLPSVLLVDSREGDRYRGEREPIDPVAGHIPGAVNSPWQQVTDERGFVRPLAEQQSLWEPYPQADEIIVYCGSGVTACANLLSLELAGKQNTKLYPGSWSDWCSYLT